jgi:hypothetical protein
VGERAVLVCGEASDDSGGECEEPKRAKKDDGEDGSDED